MNEKTCASLRGLTKQFGGCTAVNGINLQFQRGEVVAFLGPNGAGKSTTIEMMLGLTEPTRGEINILGEAPSRAARTGRVAVMLQTGALIEDQTVGQVLKLIAKLHGASHRLDQLVEESDLRGLWRRKIRKCSGGERQRVRLVMALLSDPEILILDEPTAGMDPAARRAFWDTMRAHARSGQTIIFATHYLEEAENFAQRTIIMNHGQILADGPTEQVRTLASSHRLRVAPAAQADQAVWEELERLVSATPADSRPHLRRNGSVIEISGDNVRDLAVAALQNPQVADVELTKASLDEVFLELTQEGNQND